MKDEVQIQEGQIFITILTLCRGLAGKLSVVIIITKHKMHKGLSMLLSLLHGICDVFDKKDLLLNST